MKLKKLFLSLIFLLLFFFVVCNSHIVNSASNELNWYFVSNKNNLPPTEPKESENFLNKYDGLFLGNIENKEIFLTFDEGYENGNTLKILDILKETNTKAAFFVVKPYIAKYPDIIKRMVSEGHLVCNHSSKHLSMPSLCGDSFIKEFTDTEKEFKNLIGSDMPKFFRPPMGKYSENSLSKTKNLGYKTIFWSFAYRDWLINEQPDPNFAKNKIINGVHPGCIMLLHAVSDTNVKILKDVIITLKNNGYTFKDLNSL